MNRWQGLVLSASVVAGALMVGCAGDTSADDEAPAVEADGLDTQDYGSSWNGWSMDVSLRNYVDNGNGTYQLDKGSFIFYKQSGSDSTRGGGSCVVLKKFGSSCTNDLAGDQSCTTHAQQTFGSSAWGYCFGGACYHRPGSQADFCIVGPSWTPGIHATTSTVSSFTFPSSGYNAIPRSLGCMTKTAGPNTACGSTTSTSGYVRDVALMSEVPQLP